MLFSESKQAFPISLNILETAVYNLIIIFILSYISSAFQPTVGTSRINTDPSCLSPDLFQTLCYHFEATFPTLCLRTITFPYKKTKRYYPDFTCFILQMLCGHLLHTFIICSCFSPIVMIVIIFVVIAAIIGLIVGSARLILQRPRLILLLSVLSCFSRV